MALFFCDAVPLWQAVEKAIPDFFMAFQRRHPNSVVF
jgi:hypothetical protein